MSVNTKNVGRSLLFLKTQSNLWVRSASPLGLPLWRLEGGRGQSAVRKTTATEKEKTRMSAVPMEVDEQTQEQERIHPYYNLLPSYITKDDITREKQEFLRQITEIYNVLLNFRDGKDGIKLKKHHFRVIQTLFELKHALPETLHKELIELLVQLLWKQESIRFDDLELEIRAVATLRLLLEKWAHKKIQVKKTLQIQWHLARQAIERVCFKRPGSVQLANHSLLSNLSSETVKCVIKSRKFLVATDSNVPYVVELWEEFRQDINDVKHTHCFKAVAMFSLLFALPEDPEGTGQVQQLIQSTLLPQWISAWTKVTKCQQWDDHWMKIMARTAKSCTITSAWDQYLPFVFAKLHDVLELPSDLGNTFSSTSWPQVFDTIKGSKGYEEYATTLCVYLLRNSNNGRLAPANQFVLEILNKVKAFFHPSNVTNSANSIGVSLYYLSKVLALRFGREKGKRDMRNKLELEACHPIMDTLLEICFMGIYSKNRHVASKCMYLVKNLISIDPAHCTRPVMDEMIKALDPTALSQTHLAYAAISALGVVFEALLCGRHPKGTGLFFSTYLAPVLRLTLAGIDANDEQKTARTTTLYFIILSWLPIVNDTAKTANLSATKQRGELSERLFKKMSLDCCSSIEPLSATLDQQIWELGPVLEEWSIALLDRCFELLRLRVSATGGTQHTGTSRVRGASSKIEGEDSTSRSVLNILQLLYVQMSPDIYKQALRKTISFVSNSFFTTPFGRDVVALVVGACVQGDPDLAIPQFMEVVRDGLHIRQGGMKVESLMLNEKLWFLSIFDGIMRRGSATEVRIREFKPEICRIFEHFIKNETEKDIYELAGKALRHTIYSLLDVYPASYRSLPPAQWVDATSNQSGMFQYLGAAVPTSLAAIEWHEPNADDIVFGMQLLEEYTTNAIADLGKLMQENDANVRKWIPLLTGFSQAIKGAKNLLVDASATANPLFRSSLPLLSRTLADMEGLHSKILNLKTDLLEKVHQWVEFWRVNGSGSTMDIQMWQTLLSTIHSLVIWRGDYLQNQMNAKKQNNYRKMLRAEVASKALRKARRDWIDDPYDVTLLASRADLCETVSFFYSERKFQEHNEFAYFILSGTNERLYKCYTSLLNDAESLLTNPYEAVRTKASKIILQDGGKLYSRWLHSRLSFLVQVLENDSATSGTVKEEVFMGPLTVISSNTALSHLWKFRGRLLARVIVALLKSNDIVLKKIDGDAGKVKISAKVQEVFLKLLGNWRYSRHVEPKVPILEDILAAEPPASEHWKVHLMHLVCLYPFLQKEEMPVPDEVWDLTLKNLKSDILPVRQVALVILEQLSKVHSYTAVDSAAYAKENTRLYSCSTLKDVVHAMLSNHKDTSRFAASADGQHDNSAPSNWSFGVNEVIRYLAVSYPKPLPLSSVRLAHQAAVKSIVLSNIKFVKKLVVKNPVAFFGSGIVDELKRIVAANLDPKVADEDRQAAMATLAELIAGILRGLVTVKSLDDDQVLHHVGVAVELIKTILPQTSLPLIEPWARVFFLISRPPKKSREGKDRPVLALHRLEALVLYVLEELKNSFALATVDDYSRQAKWLVLLEPLVVHLFDQATEQGLESPLGFLAMSMKKQILSVITEHALTHQYKMVRECVGKMLCILALYDQVGGAKLPIDQLVLAANEQDDTTASGTVEGEGGNSTPLYAKETAMKWLACADHHGDTRDVLNVLNQLFPIALQSQNHPKPEVALLARHTTDDLSSALRVYYPPANCESPVSPADLDNILTLLEEFRHHRVWKTRGAVLRFLMTFSFYHWIFLSKPLKDRVHALVLSFLTDDQREVQDMAKYALRGLVHSMLLDDVEVMSTELMQTSKQSRVKHPKLQRRFKQMETEGSATPEELTQAKSRIKTNEDQMAISVLSMSAIILAFPYTVPKFVPVMFEELGKYLYMKTSSTMVSYLEKVVKDTLLEFKRTHQDNWQETKLQFTPAQLDVIEDVQISPNYFS